jgi:hypothetical protein
MLLSSVAEPEPHHFGGAVAGAVTQCGSGSNSSGLNSTYRFSKLSQTVTVVEEPVQGPVI